MNIHRRSTANSARAGPAVRGAAPLGVSLGAACSAGVGLAPVSVEAVDCGTLAGGSYVSSTTWSTAAPVRRRRKEGGTRTVGLAGAADARVGQVLHDDLVRGVVEPREREEEARRVGAGAGRVVDVHARGLRVRQWERGGGGDGGRTRAPSKVSWSTPPSERW